MKGFTHLAAGTLAGLTISQSVCPDQGMTTILVVAACAAGSLLPDIDVGTSKLGRRIPALAYTLQIIFGHRGVFHSLTLWGAVLLYLLWNFPQFDLYLWSLGGGILSHLLLDMLNPLGVQLLWPMEYRFTIAGFHSGGLIDWLLGGLLTVGCLCVLFYAGR